MRLMQKNFGPQMFCLQKSPRALSQDHLWCEGHGLRRLPAAAALLKIVGPKFLRSFCMVV